MLKLFSSLVHREYLLHTVVMLSHIVLVFKDAKSPIDLVFVHFTLIIIKVINYLNSILITHQCIITINEPSVGLYSMNWSIDSNGATLVVAVTAEEATAFLVALTLDQVR